MADSVLTILQGPLKMIYLLQPHVFFAEQLQLISDVLFHRVNPAAGLYSSEHDGAERSRIEIVLTVIAVCRSQNHAETSVHLFIYRGMGKIKESKSSMN